MRKAFNWGIKTRKLLAMHMVGRPWCSGLIKLYQESITGGREGVKAGLQASFKGDDS